MLVTCKFHKKIIQIRGKDTFTAKKWAYALFGRLDFINWGPTRELIINRDPKFPSKF